jgi:hypothetical protein
LLSLAAGLFGQSSFVLGLLFGLLHLTPLVLGLLLLLLEVTEMLHQRAQLYRVVLHEQILGR